MKITALTASAALLSFALVSANFASAEELAFPDKCKSDMAMSGDMMQGHDMSKMPAHQKESMEGMKSMDMNMMQGMMKKDPDVAFNCGMIAHHMGAISMAETELKHGKDKASKARAQQIIDAQKKEIKEMSAWVDKHVK
ncbi:DUF305 domain-containing protein [Gellertiella hungarica]|uniref:Uncharacterized protein (DUF305 family) n=1 Tax=Gellertiella hungarica TaxID=1572859 RepID=A0A7W6J9G4_9HYPH|nr:DUF305 domain-containing protein [Gellertiella hungarica]MBB4067258.1 uncharacterized protein (DUF305 family) [Gellertiella hungarica]